MNLLLDTHALAWWWHDEARLPGRARAAIGHGGNTVLVSAASAWEIATKHRLGKWPEAGPIVAAFESWVEQSSFRPLPVTIAHALAAGTLPGTHGDPFDRLLVAQAMQEDAVLVTADPAIATFSIRIIWD